MNKNTINLIKRSAQLTAFAMVSVWLIYCGQRYNAVPYSFIPSVMCTITAFIVFFTGAALFGNSSEFDE